MENEWVIVKYRHPSGHFIVKHNIPHLQAGRYFSVDHYVWPHDYDNSSEFYKFGHCMRCKKKAPDHIILQLQVLNSGSRVENL